MVRLRKSAVRSLSLAIAAQKQFLLKRHVCKRNEAKALIVFVVKDLIHEMLILRLKFLLYEPEHLQKRFLVQRMDPLKSVTTYVTVAFEEIRTKLHVRLDLLIVLQLEMAMNAVIVRKGLQIKLFRAVGHTDVFVDIVLKTAVNVLKNL